VYLDIDGTKRDFVLTSSGKKGAANLNGVYPLVFVGDTYIGDREEIEDLNESGELLGKLQ